MKHHLSKFLSLLLVTAMLLQLLPASVFATESTDEYLNTLAEERPETAEEALDSAQILFEEESLREESVKHFRLDDGTYIAVNYGTPVHYEDNGEWVDYDNTLKAINSLDGSGVSFYRVDNGDSTRVFAAEADADALLLVQKEDYGLAFTPVQKADLPIDLNQPIIADDTVELAPSATVLDFASSGAVAEDDLLSQTQPDKLYSALEYENAINGATLRYENYGNTIKESIVISEPQSEYVYSFAVETDGLTAELQADGSVNFAKEDGTVVYYIPAPYMIDAEGEYSYDAAYTLTREKGAYILTVTANADWMNDETRSFPVVLDPTIIEPHISSGTFSGTYVRSGYANAASDSTSIYVGNNGNENQMTRGYFHADSIPWLPVGSEVFYAEFSLYQHAYEKQTNGATSLEVGLYPMEVCPTPDMQTAQWQTYIANLTWTQANSTYLHGNTLIDKVTVSESTNLTYSTWNITNLARKWYGEYNMNLGFALIAENETSATSRVSFYGPRSARTLPKFMVAYRSGVGVEGYYSYQTLGIGRAGTSYISDYTLQNTLIVPLTASASNTMPFSLALVYNSVYCANQFDDDNNICTKDFSAWQTGAGWKLSIQQTIVQKTVGDITYLVYNDADGTEHYFVYSSQYGAYADIDGLGLKITGSASSYTMEDLYGEKKIFTNGYLSEERDAYGNRLTYTYDADQAIITVKRHNVGCAEETLALIGYNATSKRLTSVIGECNFSSETDKTAHRTSFTYTTSDSVLLLTGITFPDSQQAQYTYYPKTADDWAQHRLKTAYDAEGDYGLEYSYSYGLNVHQIYEYVGNFEYGAKMHTFKRSHNQTVYRYYGDDGVSENDDDFLTFVIHDAYGRAVTVYTTDSTEKNILAASAGSWTENNAESRKNNRLTQSVSSGLQSVNLLSNGTMEENNVAYNGLGTWLRSSETYVMPKNVSYEQQTSVAFVRTAASTTADNLYQTVSVTKGKTYALSAYIKIADTVTFSQVGGVRLQLCNASGTALASSERLNYATTSAQSGWFRLTLTYTAQSTATVQVRISATGYTGTIYVDAVQLEEASAASTFNFVENGSFEVSGTFGTAEDNVWYRNGTATNSTASSYFGSRAAVLSGTGNHRVLQRYNMNLPADSTFILTGWGKANADPNGVAAKTNDSDPYFGLIAHLYYSDGNDDVFYYPFDVYYTGWQYTEGVVVPENATNGATITKIYIAAAYDNNFGTAYMDNISLRLEPVQSYDYNSNGLPVASSESGTGTQTATYTSVDLTQQTAANGNAATYTYNDQHDILTATSDGVKNTLTYDTSGNVTNSAVTGGSLKMSTNATYTADRNQTATETDAAGNTTTYGYDSTNRLLTSVTDAKGTKTNYHYNANNDRPTKTEQTGVASIAYTYSKGQLSTLTRTSFRNSAQKTQTYNLAYNDWGQSTALSVGSLPLVGYTYEPNGGNQTQMTYANGDGITYHYDDLDRLTKKVYTDTEETVEYYYNDTGAVVRIEHATAMQDRTTYRFEYDSLGRVIRSSLHSEQTELQRTEHIYDAFNRLSSQRYIIGGQTFTESYTYSDGASGDGNLTQMTTAHGKTISYTYDALKRLTNKDVKNGATAVVAYAYAYKNGTTSGTTTPLVEYHNVRTKDGSLLTGAKYEYDAVGNITQISQSTSPYNPLVEYTYDSQNQLVKEVYYDGNGTASSNITNTYEYTYDTAGNILTEKVNGTNTKTYTYGNAQWNDLLTKFNSSTNYYDTVGNPLIYNNGNYRFTMEWERGRQLSKATSNDGTTQVTFAYDVNGIRMAKIVNGTPHRYLTQNGKVVRETIGSGSTAKILDFIYDESGKPCALIYTNGTATPLTYYYVLNLQGDVVKLVNANGESRAEYTYNAWGEILSSSGTMAEINPLRYRGYYYDTETGFYYLQSRYYDPITHRFLNADSFAYTGQGILGTNMFAYCNNNPIGLIDTSGQASYKNTIEKQENGSYSVTTTIRFLWSTHTYKYTILANGVISFNFEENKYWSLVWRGNTKILAKAMYNACQKIDDDFLAHRTIKGIDVELKLHYAAFKAKIKYESSHEADIGGFDVDSNAWFFETANAASIAGKLLIPGYLTKSIEEYL